MKSLDCIFDFELLCRCVINLTLADLFFNFKLSVDAFLVYFVV